jgi:hypothetical protein
MRIAIALSVFLIGSTAVAADAIHLNCTGMQFHAGFNNNASYPATISLVIGPDFVQGSDGIGGQIVQADERGIVFMTNSYIAETSDGGKTSTRRDVCIYGSIDRTTGKAGVSSTYGKCNGTTAPSQGPFELASYYDVLCAAAKRLF